MIALLEPALLAAPLCPVGNFLTPELRRQREAVLRRHIQLFDPQSKVLDATAKPPGELDWWAFEDEAWPKPVHCIGGEHAELSSDRQTLAKPGCNSQWLLRGSDRDAVLQSCWKCTQSHVGHRLFMPILSRDRAPCGRRCFDGSLQMDKVHHGSDV